MSMIKDPFDSKNINTRRVQRTNDVQQSFFIVAYIFAQPYTEIATVNLHYIEIIYYEPIQNPIAFVSYGTWFLSNSLQRKNLCQVANSDFDIQNVSHAPLV